MAARKWTFPFKVLAHRGGGTMVPENTMCAFETGLRYGYNSMEFDVMLTADKKAIIIHDEILQRTVHAGEFEGKSVSEVHCEDILAMDAGSWKDPSFAHVRVPLFKNVLEYCVSNNIVMNIEIKPATNFDTETGEVVAALTAEYFPTVNSKLMPLISSFSYDSLVAAKRVANHIPRAFLIESIDDTPDWKERMSAIDAISLNVNHKLLTHEAAMEIKAAGYLLFCYTVNDIDRARELLAIGVDAFCTDRLDLFQGVQL